MKELVGKHILSLSVNDDQSMLMFDTNAGPIIYEAEGDCCSDCWFADILFSYGGIDNSIVLSVEELEVPDWLERLMNTDGRTRQEEDNIYGYRLILDRESRMSSTGTCDIIYRNSSNGYYGGWCSVVDPSAKWVIEKLGETSWVKITGDWKA